jgi:hypothetical protein
MKRLVIPKTMAGLCTVAALASWAAPREADACGGTFCDGGPNQMPVDQSGENILFIRDGASIEAHIQIAYMGDPAKFSWVIPLQSVPEFSVGSEQLFQALLAGSVPTYGFSTVMDDCSVPQDPGNDGATGPAGSSGTGGGRGDEGGADGGGPDILLMEQVGAYEITVLSGGSADEVITWLNDNGYAQDPEAEPILQEYVTDGFLFGAIKLTGGAGVDEIHPVALRFDSPEPCIPLKLTRIAALEDMEVRTFFLGTERTVPRNYRHVQVNELKIDWLALGANYKEVITLAVDEENADGRAFVTEYAGPSNVVQNTAQYANLFNPAWDAAAYAAVDPLELGDLLQQHNLVFCDFDFGNGCSFQNAMVEGVLTPYLPVPAGVPAAEFYACVSCYQADADLTMWDGAAVAMLMQDRIFTPGQHAKDLVDQHPYLTRMYTTISPAEMTEDPLFWENPNFEEVPNIRLGTNRILCNSDSVFTLPSGREVYLPQGSGWPQFPNEPPWSEIIEETPNVGAAVQLVNNTAEIDASLALWNQQNGWPGGGSGSGSGSASGGQDESGSDSGGQDGDGSGSACSCTVDETGQGLIATAFTLMVLVSLRRRWQ